MTLTMTRLRRYRDRPQPVSADHAAGARVDRLGFVQADPIRAPARAQDLTLRHRVAGYRAGDLERRYARSTSRKTSSSTTASSRARVQALMHPRGRRRRWPSRAAQAGRQAVLDFVRERGAVHPREVDAHFAHGAVTQLLGRLVERDDAPARRDALPRAAARARGATAASASTRRTSTAPRRPARPARRVAASTRWSTSSCDVYAPLPAREPVVPRQPAALRRAAVARRADARAGAREARLAHARVDGVDWYWPAGGDACRVERVPDDACACWRRSIRWCGIGAASSCFWGWAYRFEAYTPAAKRKLGYYALPLLWRDRVIGWGNLSVADGALQASLGFARGRPPRSRDFNRGLDASWRGCACSSAWSAGDDSRHRDDRHPRTRDRRAVRAGLGPGRPERQQGLHGRGATLRRRRVGAAARGQGGASSPWPAAA